jgi:hypothetical protein
LLLADPSQDRAISIGAEARSFMASDDFDIEHSTFQLETADRRRFEERSHA